MTELCAQLQAMILDGTLEGAETEEIRDHLETCEECQEVVALERFGRELVVSGPPVELAREEIDRAMERAKARVLREAATSTSQADHPPPIVPALCSRAGADMALREHQHHKASAMALETVRDRTCRSGGVATTVGIVDDTQFELDAFRAAFEPLGKFRIITAQEPEEFIARLKAEGPVHLLLFDLYFPDERRRPKPPADHERLSQLCAPLVSAQDNLTKATTAEAQMAFADLCRREAGNVLSSLLDRFAQGPSGGLAVFSKVRAEFPLVPSVFVSRKRNAEDVPTCLEAGALEVILKPSPLRAATPRDVVEMARWGWEDHRSQYVDCFERLARVDVVERHLAGLDDMLARLPSSEAMQLSTALSHARLSWRSRQDEGNTEFRRCVDRVATAFLDRVGTAAEGLLRGLAAAAGTAS